MRTLILCSFIFLIPVVTIPQEKDFKTLKEEMEQEFDSLELEYEQEFNDFVDSINIEYINHILESEKEFSRLLEGSFKEYEILPGDGKPAVSKPKQIPAYKKESIRNINAVQSGRGTLFNVNHEIIQVQKGVKAEDVRLTGRTVINFYGRDFFINYDTAFSIIKLNSIGPKTIKTCFDFLLNTEYSSVIDQMTQICSQMNLSDWDYYCLVNEFSKKVSNRNNVQKLIAWFLLIESGYKVKIGYFDDELAILFASSQTIYNLPWFNIRGERYYAQLFDHDRITTYDLDYFKGNRSINIYNVKPLLFADAPKSKTIRFPFRGNNYSINLSYDQNYVDYYSKYPDIQVEYYFSIPVSTVFKESVEAEIAPLLRNKNQYESLFFLLSLVQYGFAYKTDTEQFDKEKYMVPEETIHYKYSDCEDRAILFSWLTSELLRLENIALDFNGHLCVAVELTDPGIKGNFKYDGRDFIVCDATYSGAPPGVILPQYQLKAAKIIDFNKRLGSYSYSAGIWQKANKHGLFQAENTSNIVSSDSGAIFITGISTNNQDSAEINNPGTFVAKISSSEEILWIKRFYGTGINFGYSLASYKDEFLYVFGYYENSMKIDRYTINSGQNGSFYLAQLDLSGKAVWLRNIEFPKDLTCRGIAAILDKEGNMKYYMPNDHYPPEKSFMIEVDDKGFCYLFAALPDLKSGINKGRSFASGDEYNIISYLLKGNENMLMHNYPRSVSFLYTLIQFLNESKESAIQGRSILKAITEIYSNVIMNFNDRYSEIEKISEIVNMDGIMTIKTINQQPVTINQIQAQHESRLKISYFNGNAKINVLNGVRIGRDQVWNRVNYILLDKLTGEIVFNYDNQYMKKMPVHSQVL